MSDDPRRGEDAGQEPELPSTQPVAFEPPTGRHSLPTGDATPPADPFAMFTTAQPQQPAQAPAEHGALPNEPEPPIAEEPNPPTTDALDALFGGIDEPEDESGGPATVPSSAQTVAYPAAADPLAWLGGEQAATTAFPADRAGAVPDEAVTQRFDAGTSSASQLSPTLAAAERGGTVPPGGNRRLIIGLIVAGAVLLVAILVLVLFMLLRSGASSSAPSDSSSPSPAASSSPSASPSPTPSETPSASPTPTPSATSAALPAPTIGQFNVVANQATGVSSTVGGGVVPCSSTSGTVNVGFTWTSANGAKVFIGVDVTDASTGSLYSDLAATGQLPDGSHAAPVFACGEAQHSYTLTVLTADGQKASKTLTLVRTLPASPSPVPDPSPSS